jgi:hypothetical protein
MYITTKSICKNVEGTCKRATMQFRWDFIVPIFADNFSLFDIVNFGMKTMFCRAIKRTIQYGYRFIFRRMVKTIKQMHDSNLTIRL